LNEFNILVNVGSISFYPCRNIQINAAGDRDPLPWSTTTTTNEDFNLIDGKDFYFFFFFYTGIYFIVIK